MRDRARLLGALLLVLVVVVFLAPVCAVLGLFSPHHGASLFVSLVGRSIGGPSAVSQAIDNAKGW